MTKQEKVVIDGHCEDCKKKIEPGDVVWFIPPDGGGAFWLCLACHEKRVPKQEEMATKCHDCQAGIGPNEPCVGVFNYPGSNVKFEDMRPEYLICNDCHDRRERRDPLKEALNSGEPGWED